MPSLDQPTGAEILSIVPALPGTSPTIDGGLDADAIDADISSNGSRSHAVREWNRVKGLIEGSGLDPDNLNSDQLVEAQVGLYWSCYALYLQSQYTASKRHGKNDRCMSADVFMAKQKEAKNCICEAWRNLGITDRKWCGSLLNELQSKAVTYCYKS